MDWYSRELMTKDREREIERAAERRRSTTSPARPVHFWLVAMLRAWIIGVPR